MKNKNCRVNLRLNEVIMRKLLAICRVKNATKTAIIEDLIKVEYEKNRKYSDIYYQDLEKKV